MVEEGKRIKNAAAKMPIMRRKKWRVAALRLDLQLEIAILARVWRDRLAERNQTSERGRGSGREDRQVKWKQSFVFISLIFINRVSVVFY